jgi:hypothetical protein
MSPQTVVNDETTLTLEMRIGKTLALARLIRVALSHRDEFRGDKEAFSTIAYATEDIIENLEAMARLPAPVLNHESPAAGGAR